ncbi:glycosyltransferase [Teredinibacter purpureus]|jgi:Glycosyltransferases, probably involved in cell wall biogenesis|uniref:glycosyltransferase n=1 Tax=Teredinibacter purpureus TaxID=2731756 RepID=UPI0005F784D4|nr:glycosyltransferase family A protein [Teredinibacter purpureus]
MVTQHEKISFVIPHRGRENLLQDTLASITQQKLNGQCLEVVVVTQNTALETSTMALIEALQGNVVFRPEHETISRMRNIGCEETSGDYLAFLDADVELAPDWVVSMLGALYENPKRVIVSAMQRCDNAAPVLEKIRTTLSNVSTECNVDFLPGRNLFLRRTVFSLSGGFPENLVTCEDYFFTQKVAEQGELFYTSRTNYIHLGEDKAYGSMFKKEIWRGQSNLQSMKGRKIPLAEWPSFLVPVWVLLFAVSTVISLVAGSVLLAVVSGMLTLFPVVLYSIRLYGKSAGTLSLRDIMRFYVLYFPARIIGTLTGLFKIVKL